MNESKRGGWVYILTNRHRGTLYVGVTSSLAHRISQHRTGTGSDFCKRENLTRLVWVGGFATIDEAIAHEKRLKRWHRDWKIELIEKDNPDWEDLYESILT